MTVDGSPVRSLNEAEAASQASASVQLGVVRDGAPFAVTAPMLPSDGLGTTRVLGWAGLLLQETPDAVRAQRSVPAQGGVYASYRFYGSPSSRYDLSPTSHIIEVDSVPTPTLRCEQRLFTPRAVNRWTRCQLRPWPRCSSAHAARPTARCEQRQDGRPRGV